jgi:hypothetical protein
MAVTLSPNVVTVIPHEHAQTIPHHGFHGCDRFVRVPACAESGQRCCHRSTDDTWRASDLRHRTSLRAAGFVGDIR